jgi:multidrug efflux pump subunit AcrA (membrane-fusion protein)
MFVTANFRGKQEIERSVVPASAIVHLRDQDWVFVAAGDNRFRKVGVQTAGAAGDGLVQILSGVNPGEKVVANALQFSSEAEEQ